MKALNFAGFSDKAALAAAMALVIAAGSSAALGQQPAGAKSVLDSIERKITNEPTYNSTPRYALVVLGTNAESKVWLVEDGEALYVDKNANGDLTDDGPPIEPSNRRELGTGTKGKRAWDFDYLLDEIRPANGSRHTALQLRRWNYGDAKDSYGLSLSVDGKIPMYAGWFFTFWATTPAEVPLVHFGGPLEIRMLRSRNFVIGSKLSRLSIGLVNPGRGEGATTQLSIEALPRDAVPVVDIDWPVADGTPPLRESYRLIQRCCYWEFYEENFQVPARAVPGTAKLTVTLSGGSFPFELASHQVEVPVRAGTADSTEQ